MERLILMCILLGILYLIYIYSSYINRETGNTRKAKTKKMAEYDDESSVSLSSISIESSS